MPVLRGTVATTTDIRGTIKMKPLIPFPFECILILFSLYGHYKYVARNTCTPPRNSYRKADIPFSNSRIKEAKV